MRCGSTFFRALVWKLLALWTEKVLVVQRLLLVGVVSEVQMADLGSRPVMLERMCLHITRWILTGVSDISREIILDINWHLVRH